MDDERTRQGIVVYVLSALLVLFILVAVAGVFCPVDGEATFRELLIRDCLIAQPASECACAFSRD